MKSTMATILDRCCHGARLVRTNLADRAVFSLEPGGARVSRRLATRAIRSGWLKPANDGLFEDFSQSWIGVDPESHTKDSLIMSNTALSKPSRLDALFEQLDPVKARLIFAVDATASRQPTWDMASRLTSEMFRAATAAGGLDIQLVYFRGERECTASRWMSDAGALATVMSRVMCASGHTQIARVLGHVEREDQRQKIAAVVFIGDACEELPSELFTVARRLNRVPCFMFQEGADVYVGTIYRKIAEITGGASGAFDVGAAARLAELLRAVVAYATGGRAALANEKSEAARWLLSQVK
jgi:hypothetical protein